MRYKNEPVNYHLKNWKQLSPKLLRPLKQQKKPGWSLDEIRDDPTDDKYVSCAVEAGAEYIVSGDEHLKAIERYQGIEILAPAAFLRDVLGLE